MDFTFLTENFTPVVMVACLVVGYLIKTSITIIPNKFIPVILAGLGAVLNAVVIGVTVDAIVYGAVIGLASTGLHQAFKQFIEKSDSE